MKTLKKLFFIALALIVQLLSAQGNKNAIDNYCNVHSIRGNNYISNVKFSDINHYSQLGINGYSNFTERKANIEPGKEYTIKVDTKWNHWSFNSIQVWIDWNGDTSFDSTERVFNKIGKGVISGAISIPEDAKIGTTRMRVRYNYNIMLGPCESKRNVSGEIEDYTIEVLHPERPQGIFDASSTHVYDDKELVQFSDFSTNNPTSWYWEFQDGIPSTSTDQFPLVRYIKSGSFSVKLVVENEFGKDEVTYTNYIKANIKAPVLPPFCDFSTEKTLVTDPDEPVRFDDKSENNPTSWFWEFEGAIPATSREKAPQITYSKSGKYSVRLTVSNSYGEDSKTVQEYITVAIAPKELCTSSNKKPSGQYITRVEFSNINNVSSYNQSGYSKHDFSGTFVDRGPIEYPNEASVIHIKTNVAWDTTKTGYWVDWNQDGDFDDQGEEKLLPNHSSNGEWVSFFTIPPYAKLGKTTLRVRTIYNDELTPCGEGWFGETEDYIIQVVDDPRRNFENNSIDGQTSTIAQKVVIAPNPSNNGVFTFTFNESKETVLFKVFNNNGLEVTPSPKSHSGKNITLNLSNLKPGIYTVQVTTQNSFETVRLAIQ